jgi:chemotaxis signal transduction protein
MNAASSESFVLFPLGRKRFALPAGQVSELARPDVIHTFPSNTRMVCGVLLRRGEVIPVCDVAQELIGKDAPARKFYLIAKRRFEKKEESAAIPVSGDCELTSSQLLPPTGKLAAYVSGLLSLEKEIVEVIDLEKLMSEEAQ